MRYLAILTSHPQRLLFFVVVPVCCVVGALANWIGTIGLINATLPLLVVAFFGVGITIIVGYARRGEALSLLPLITGFYLLAFALGALYYRYPGTAVGSSALVGFRNSYTTQGLVVALALTFLAYMVFAGSFITSGFMRICRRLPKPGEIPSDRLVFVIGLLLAVGWLARVLTVEQGLYFRYTVSGTVGRQTTQLSTLITIIANVPLLAFALVATERTRTGRLGPTFWIMLVAEIAWAVPSGERARIVGLALVLLVNRYYTIRRQLPWRQIVAGLLVVVFIVFPFGALYRGRGAASGYQRAPLAQAGVAAGEMVSNIGALPTLAFDETLSRFSDIASVATITTKGRNLYPNSAGKTLTLVAQGLIPRFLFPAKSNPGNIGNEFAHAYDLVFRTSQADVSTTYVGDLYGSFGFWGMLVGMAILGMLTRGLDEYLHNRRTSPVVLAIFATMLGAFLLRQESTVVVGFIQSFKEVFVYAVIAGGAIRLARGPIPVVAFRTKQTMPSPTQR